MGKRAIVRYEPTVWAVCVFLATTIAAPAYGEEFDVAGEIEVTSDHDVHALSEDHVVLLASMQEHVVLDDQTGPWHGATGPCGGAVEIRDGTVSGDGLCALTDREGDRFVIAWTARSMNEQGGPVGVWTLTGGTGRYVDAEASGEYSDVPSEDPSVSTVTLTGTLVLP